MCTFKRGKVSTNISHGFFSSPELDMVWWTIWSFLFCPFQWVLLFVRPISYRNHLWCLNAHSCYLPGSGPALIYQRFRTRHTERASFGSPRPPDKGLFQELNFGVRESLMNWIQGWLIFCTLANTQTTQASYPESPARFSFDGGGKLLYNMSLFLNNTTARKYGACNTVRWMTARKHGWQAEWQRRQVHKEWQIA